MWHANFETCGACSPSGGSARPERWARRACTWRSRPRSAPVSTCSCPAAPNSATATSRASARTRTKLSPYWSRHKDEGLSGPRPRRLPWLQYTEYRWCVPLLMNESVFAFNSLSYQIRYQISYYNIRICSKMASIVSAFNLVFAFIENLIEIPLMHAY